jgi:uncharacterized protein (DUF302 family)
MEKNNLHGAETVSSKQKRMGCKLHLVIGFVVGIIIVGIVGRLSMPSMMLKIHQSRYATVEETCLQLKAAIEDIGWSCPGIRDMNKTMVKHGVTMSRQVRIVELCKAEYAKDVLETDPEVSTLMPCAWGVYEGDDGKVYIAGMNVGLMGKLFGGNIAKVMGESVSRDEARILKRVIVE